jgi:phosphoglycolate phosphatase-like HAD superfamily hydrolase
MGNSNWSIEVINKNIDGSGLKSTLFDFDGTISLVREGWQNIMVPLFIEVLKDTPDAEDEKSIEKCVRDFVDILTGKQTIYQCMRLAEEVNARGGTALDPLEYKREYHNRLMTHIKNRIEGLKAGKLKARDYVVPGSYELLDMLKKEGFSLYLASGTDENYVLEEAELLGVTDYFDGGIYGAQDDIKLFSKAMVIQKIIKEHNFKGSELIGFGDGYVEIENVKSAGGVAIGVASNESQRCGIDEWKRGRLIGAGADAIIPDYSDIDKMYDFFFKEVR